MIRNKWRISRKKKKLTETIPEKAQALYLLDKDFKSSVLNLLKERNETRWQRTVGNKMNNVLINREYP